jgi:mannose-1-phosphate guanylyltransferase/mannose-6-phosphate isomerase
MAIEYEEGMRHISPFILCGGSGTRMWPLSREAFPKQFHRLTGAETLFQQTCRRLAGPLFGDCTVLSNRRHRFLVAEQLDELGMATAKIVLEPVGRNTAPAACTAALIAGERDPDALVLIAPSDHMLAEAEPFVTAVEAGLESAEAGALVTFGITPDCPHTGYGYIETDRSNAPVRTVKRFVEKPSPEMAEAYLDAGGFYWNAGIFLFRAKTLLELVEIHAPEILAACRLALTGAASDLTFTILGEAYAQAPSISIDYAIAEKAPKMACVPLATPWSDIGSWSALWSFMEKDTSGNVVRGGGKIILESTQNTFAYSDQACVALLGVKDIVVVATEDAVLVASTAYAEEVKGIVEQLKDNGGSHTLHHNRVYRPWGWYQTLNQGERYQVKCIMVKPGGKLSLQSHHHRSEHWVVVRGTLEVTKGEETALLTENQSTYIPIGKRHRLANPGKIPAFLIEVQSGPYLDESDIVRYDDVYRRGADE